MRVQTYRHKSDSNANASRHRKEERCGCRPRQFRGSDATASRHRKEERCREKQVMGDSDQRSCGRQHMVRVQAAHAPPYPGPYAGLG
eukprot:123556-Pelagomonas_calceolata.AAC.2